MAIKRRGAAPDTNRPIDRVGQYPRRSVPPKRKSRKPVSLTGIFLVFLVFAALGVVGYMYLGNGTYIPDIPIWQSDSGSTGIVYEPYDLGESLFSI